MSDPFLTVHEIIVEARRKASPYVWNYISGGSESETTLRRNRQSLDSLAFRPRVLRDVSSIDTRATVLGHRLRIPVMLAPIGSLQTILPEGAIAPARVAHEFGTIGFVSSVTQPDLEKTAASTPHPKIFQLYLQGDLKWVEEVLGRVKRAGYAALALTVDAIYYGIHERQLIRGWVPQALKNEKGRDHQLAMTWETLNAIKEIGGMPFILKGVATAEDAALAVEHGVQAVYVSNHGGRQLDHGRGPIEALPEIVSAVKGRAEVIIDGGFVRGSDVLKAIALGANAVAIGKLQGWALAAAGEAGLMRALEILEMEIRQTMGLLGVTRLDQLDASFLTDAKPVTPAHATSAFPHLPDEIRP
jgi:glycolate oxidase